MTRTRTQTALAKLAQLVAEIHGELEFVGRLLQEYPEHQEALESRKCMLEDNRDALYATLRQFDSELAPTQIASSNDWLKRFGRQGASVTMKRYFAELLKGNVA